MQAGKWSLALLSAVVLFTAAISRAAESTVVDEVIRLLKAEVPERVIISYIDKQVSAGGIDADQIVALRKANASEAVLMALLGKTGGRGGVPFDLDSQHEVQAPLTRGALAVFPVVRKGPAAVTAYITLDEAMERRVLTITEKDSGAVPIVIVSNTGNLPLYISAGEVIVGGKQDRMVAYDVLVEAGRTMDIEVRCVEHGRWQGADSGFTSAKAVGGTRTRIAAQFKAQGDVWREVAAQNSAVGVTPQSGTYHASLSNPEVDREFAAYSGAILRGLEGRNIVGMIAAINGKVCSMDIFASPAMFAKMREKLLKAAVLDVIGVEDRKAAPPSREEILSFYKETSEARAEAGKKYTDNYNCRRESSTAIMNESADSKGQVLHRSYYAK